MTGRRYGLTYRCPKCKGEIPKSLYTKKEKQNKKLICVYCGFEFER